MKKENVPCFFKYIKHQKERKNIYIAAWRKRKHNGNVYICLFKMPGDERIFVS